LSRSIISPLARLWPRRLARLLSRFADHHRARRAHRVKTLGFSVASVISVVLPPARRKLTHDSRPHWWIRFSMSTAKPPSTPSSPSQNPGISRWPRW